MRVSGLPIFWPLALAILLPLDAARSQPATTDNPALTKPTGELVARQKAPDSAPEPAPGLVREKEPSLLYIPDKNGQLQPIINLSMERLEELLQADGPAKDARRPMYSLQFRAQGEAMERRVKLTFDFEIKLFHDGWVKVPLRLDEAILSPESMHYSGPGENLLVPDDSGRGYVCWLHGHGEQPHRVQITAIVPTAEIGGQTRLRLSTPMSVSASLELRVPGVGVLAQVPERDVVDTSVQGASTILKLDSARGPWELHWWHESKTVVDGGPALEASGAILVEIGGRRVQETAMLSVRSFDRPFSHFRVRLPLGAVLKNGIGPNYSAIPISSSQSRQGADGGTVCEVRLDNAAQQAEIRLITEHADFSPEKPVQFAGFEVLAARRQSGHLAISVDGDWQLIWGKHQNVHRVAEGQLPAELRREAVQFNFQYVAQPSLLEARIVERQARTIVEPSLVFRVQKQQDDLEARFRWSTAAARVSEVKLNWPDESWQIDEVGPPDLVDTAQLVPGDREPLVIPLSRPLLGDFEITVKAHRLRTADQTFSSLTAPVPIADAFKPALFVVVPADNIRLTPRTEELLGLTRQPATAIRLPWNSRQEPLSYRADGQQHYFVGDVEVLPRSIAVESKAEVAWNNERWLVGQKLVFQVESEATSSLVFRVPHSLARNSTLAVTLDGQQLPSSALQYRADTEKVDRLSIALGRDLIGPCEIGFSFSTSEAPFMRQAEIDIPLVIASDAKTIRNEVHVLPAYSVEVQPASKDWIRSPGGSDRDSSDGGFLLESATPQLGLPLAIRFLELPVVDLLAVQRCWIQTWLTDQERQDRAVFRFLTRRDRLELELPARASADSAQVFLDGRPISVRLGSRRQVVVMLDTNQSLAPRTIEVLYRCPLPDRWASRLTLDPVKVAGSNTTRFCYWQLIVPQHRVLFLPPSGYSPEYTWNWDRFFFWRRPMLEQTDLEVWVGARPERAIGGASNRYLFSTLGQPRALSTALADRSMLLLIFSGSLLMVGLVLLQVPKIRRAAAICALVSVPLTVVLLGADASILIGQASLVGLLLLLLATGLKLLTVSRRASRAVVRRPSSSVIDRGSSKTHLHQPALAGSNTSTAAAPSLELAKSAKK